MSYWDKRDNKPKVSRWREEQTEVITNGDNIDYQALDKMEEDFNSKAKDIGEQIYGISHSIDKQKSRSRDLLSSGYWFAVVFNNDIQKRQFLNALKLVETDTFILGDEMARACKININEPDHDYTERKRRNTLTKLARLKEQLEMEEKQKNEMATNKK